MKELLEKIKENCEENKTAVILMLLFVLFFCIISGPELVKEVSTSQVRSEGGSVTGEDDYDGPGDNHTQRAPGEAGDGTERETGTEAQSETETETESETETETEAETFSPEDRTRHLRRLQAQYGEAFRIPCAIPEESSQESGLTFLPDRKKLPGYHLPEETETVRSFETLRTMVENQIAGYDGDWSVYVKNLSTEESFVVNDRPMKSASVMKLFIMGTVYKAFESGELQRTDEIMSLVKDMIIYSDNAASNELLSRLGNGSYADGIACVDAFIAEYGFSEMTMEYNGFDDPATNTGTGNYNQVAAKDCGKLLEDIYRRTWVNRAVSNEMETMLLSQNTRYKIPAGLPEGVLCGNKTGEMDTTENDAAIIYSDECDYILVVLSSGWGSKDQAISRIASISSAVYGYLNPEETEE